MNNNKQFSKDQRLTYIEQWRESGDTLLVYSDRVGIPFLMLRYWANSLLKKARLRNKISVPSFLPLNISGQEGLQDDAISIEMPSGIRVTLPVTISASYIKTLIS